MWLLLKLKNKFDTDNIMERINPFTVIPVKFPEVNAKCI